MQIDHLCVVPKCVRPSHLECVTPRENTMRSSAPTAENARKTHCPKGHEYTPENTATRYGSRYCKQCDRDYQREKMRRAGARPIGTFKPWNTKLDEDKVREIRRLYAEEGLSQGAIGNQFGVSQTLVGKIVNRKVWDSVQ